jgi:hypothetical protein
MYERLYLLLKDNGKLLSNSYYQNSHPYRDEHGCDYCFIRNNFKKIKDVDLSTITLPTLIDIFELEDTVEVALMIHDKHLGTRSKINNFQVYSKKQSIRLDIK